MTVVRTKFLGIRTSDPSSSELSEAGAGAWWFREDLKQWKWYDGNEIKILPISMKSATSSTITIPLAGGQVNTSVSASDFGLSKIEAIIDLNVIREEPVVADVYSPSYGINATGDAVGISLFAGTGTTLRAEVTVVGY